jgi:hypothetical protein
MKLHTSGSSFNPQLLSSSTLKLTQEPIESGNFVNLLSFAQKFFNFGNLPIYSGNSVNKLFETLSSSSFCQLGSVEGRVDN